MKNNLTKIPNITAVNKLKPMNDNIAKLSRIFNNQSSSSGFTLIELLIAASLTTVVTGLAGSGMVAMTENNKKAQAETERRVELNRALDFISDEARQAKFVAKNASATLGIVAPTFTLSGRTPVLTLQIPGVAERVIYYIAPKPATSAWLGPNIIYRWGPPLDENGGYTNKTTPGSFTYEPVVDLIVDTALSTNPCPSIGAGWTLTTTVANAQGFYACVDPDGRIAETHLRGRLRDAYGKDRTNSFDVSTKAFARSFELAAAQGAAALAAAETAAIELAAAQAAANTAATNAATAVTNLGTLQTAANNAATALATATTALTTAQTTANTTPTAANYTALAAAERAVADAITNARNTATAATAFQIEADRTADLNVTAQAAALAAATTARTTAASAGQGSTEQAATTYATTAQNTANNAVSTYTTAAQTAATTATAAQAAVDQNAATLTTATAAAATTHTTAAQTAAQTASEYAAATRFTTSNGTIRITANSNVSFKVLGGSISCGGSSPAIPTRATFKLTPAPSSGTVTKVTYNPSQPPPSLNFSVNTGTTVTVSGEVLDQNTDSCNISSSNGGYNSATHNNTQVLTLRNGDTPPDLTPFEGQGRIDSFLTEYLDPNTKKIKLTANQVIYLFELYATDKTASSYDLQDLVVLATITQP